MVGKPNPRIFREAIKKLDARPKETIVIGDSLETDILGACNCALASIYIAPSPPPATACQPLMTVSGLEELATILEKTFK